MCLSPIAMRTETGVRSVPCGKCAECVKARRNDWALRALFEWEDTVTKKKFIPYFLTLTYDEANVPKCVDTETGLEYNVLNYDHWHQTTNYLRIAKKVSSEDYRYLLCGEYGHLHLRPHYHLLIMVRDSSIINMICDYWYDHFCPEALELINQGKHPRYKVGCYVAPINVCLADSAIKCCRYLTKYIVKGEFDATKNELKDFYVKYPARVYCSRGFGMQKLQYFADLLKQFKGRKSIYNQNKKCYEYTINYLNFIDRTLRVLMGRDLRNPDKMYYQRLPQVYFDRLLPKKMYTLSAPDIAGELPKVQRTKKRVKETGSLYRYHSEQIALSYYLQESGLRQLMADAKSSYGEGIEALDKFLLNEDSSTRLRNDLLLAEFRSRNTQLYVSEKDLQ